MQSAVQKAALTRARYERESAISLSFDSSASNRGLMKKTQSR
jgi:hypothetical protein